MNLRRLQTEFVDSQNEDERRRLRRHERELMVELHLGKYPSHLRFNCRTQDVSIGGVRLRPLPVDLRRFPRLTLVFRSDGRDPKPLPVQVRLTHLGQGGVGLCFTHMDMSSMQHLRSQLM